MNKILYRDDSYLVNCEIVNPNSIYFITFSSWHSKYHYSKPLGFSREFGGDAFRPLGLNVIRVISSRNDWYANNSIEQALLAAKEAVGDNLSITYGSSMGGYAALKFYEFLEASFFISISPQHSLTKAYMNEIGDKRWEEEVLFYQDKITAPEFASSDPFGVIIFDSKHKSDNLHAKSYAQFRNIKYIDIEYSGHPSGKIINKNYGLKNIISKVSEVIKRPKHEAEKDIDLLCMEIINSHKSSNLYKFTTAKNIQEIALIYRDLEPNQLTYQLIKNFFYRKDFSILHVYLGCLILNENVDKFLGKTKFSKVLLERFSAIAKLNKIDITRFLVKRLLDANPAIQGDCT